MDELLHHAFSPDGFMPHGMCYLWQPGILALHVVSDAFISLAYATIPFTLLYFIRRRRDLQFSWMFVCFAIFIIACGATHVMEIVTVWTPVYWLSGCIKAITAMASVPTAFLLVKLIPDALRLPSPANLRHEISVRERAEHEVRKANELLEARVTERTSQLETANKELRSEIQQRHQAEERMRSDRQLLEAIADSAAAIIYVKDPDGRYLFTSRLFDKSFGLKRGEMLNRTDEILFSQEAAAAFRAIDQRAIAADSAITEEEVVPLADGPHTFLSVKSALRDPAGKAYAMFGMSVDVTERRRIEDAHRAQRERLELLERTARAMGEYWDLASIYRVALRNLEDKFGIDLAIVCEREGEEPHMTVASIGTRSQPFTMQLALTEHTRVALNQGGFERCLTGELVYDADLATSKAQLPERLTRVNLRSLVVAPLMIDGKVVGALLCGRRLPNGFSDKDCEFLYLLAQHLSLAANQARRYDALRKSYELLKARNA